MNFYIYNPETKLFDFFIDSLKIELNKNSINMLHYDNSSLSINKCSDIILIIINPQFIFDYKHISTTIDNINIKFKFKILYLTEPINFLVQKKIYLDIIKRINPYCLWTYTFENFKKININLNTFKIFPTFNNAYNFVNIDNTTSKNSKNIIFFGNINENRKELCDQFNNYLINIIDCWTQEGWTNILKNNLLYLNIHRRLNCKSFESFRIIPILANGGVIFSERCNEKEEKEYEKYNIIFIEKNKLYDTFLNYINNINYDTIYNKALLFRNNVVKDDLDKYLFFHKSIE